MSTKKSILLNIGTLLLPLFLKLLFSTLRIDIVKKESGLPDRSRGLMFAFWHGQMITGWLLAKRLFPDTIPSAVVSLSPDGQILSDALEKLDFELIRGSSSRGRDDVKAGIAERIRNRGLVAITPDGPRGPIHRFKYGTLRLASEHRTPILFADISHEKASKLRSWDQFEIPMPFSRVRVTLHLIDVPVFSSEEELRAFADQLSDRYTHA